MVFKKPYAFLIKNFKIIHLILTAIILLVVILYSGVSGFFSEQASRPFQGFRLADEYISNLLYLVLFMIIAFSAMMFWLMKEKKKPILFYILSLAYYTGLLISVFVAANIMNSLDQQFLTPQNAFTYRDIFFVISIPQFGFLILSLVRGLGFDVKNFNFAKDLTQLEISSEDSEEFEFVLGKENYKYERKARRTLRELKYYALENKFVLSIIGGAVAIVVGLFIISTINFGAIIHWFGGSTQLNGMNFRINNTYVTPYDLNGEIIREQSRFVIVHVTVINNSGRTRTLTNVDWYLRVGRNNIFHSPQLGNHFLDIGTAYVDNQIPNGESLDTILIFEIPRRAWARFSRLSILREIEIGSDGQARYRYNNFRLRPQNMNRVPDRVETSIGEEITLGRRMFRDSTVNITSVEIVQHYRFQREICRNDVCNIVDDMISPSDPLNRRLLVIKYDLDLNDSIGTMQTMTHDRSFFERHLLLEFYFNGRVNLRSEPVRTVSGLDNIIFIEISTAIINNRRFNLMINTRENHHFINLLRVEETPDTG